MAGLIHCRRRQQQTLAIVYRWPVGTELTWYYHAETAPASVQPSDVVSAMQFATAAWSSVCNVRFRCVDRPELARIHVYFAPIDGRWYTLAQAQLPTGQADASNTLELDPAEAWTSEMLDGVILHELGHSIGLEHDEPGSDAVMAPVYTGRRQLTSRDASRAVALYGPPVPVAPPPPVNPARRPLTISFKVAQPGDYQITGAIDLVSGMLVDPALQWKG